MTPNDPPIWHTTVEFVGTSPKPCPPKPIHEPLFHKYSAEPGTETGPQGGTFKREPRTAYVNLYCDDKGYAFLQKDEAESIENLNVVEKAVPFREVLPEETTPKREAAVYMKNPYGQGWIPVGKTLDAVAVNGEAVPTKPEPVGIPLQDDSTRRICNLLDDAIGVHPIAETNNGRLNLLLRRVAHLAKDSETLRQIRAQL
jgi:hypothetical protein